MTDQEMFDFVVGKLREQGRPSITVDFEGAVHCLYRGPEGLRCAAGWAIEDSEYSEKMEGKNVSDAAKAIPRLDPFLALLSSLQVAHDHAALNAGIPRTPAQFLERLETHLEEVAKVWQLTYTPPKANHV